MRIVAGKLKSRQIQAPKGKNTRPTSDRVKESLFNILGMSVCDAHCLDLSARSGNLGIEALSRGAKSCVFVDVDKEAIQTIQNNIKTLQLQADSQIIHADYRQALKRFQTPFDLIFLDPPYRYTIIEELLDEIETKKLLTEKGIIVYESDVDKQIQMDFLRGYQIKKYQYGDTILNIFKKESKDIEN